MAADLFVRILFKNNEFDRSINKTRKQVSDFKKVTESVGGSIVSMTKGFATLGGISFALMDVTKKSMEFEKSLSGLRSLTGLGPRKAFCPAAWIPRSLPVRNGKCCR